MNLAGRTTVPTTGVDVDLRPCQADCLAECQATGGPNPVAPKSCRAQLNPATATEDEAGLPGQTGGCVGGVGGTVIC